MHPRILIGEAFWGWDLIPPLCVDGSGCVAWRTLIPTIKVGVALKSDLLNDKPDRTAASSPKGRNVCRMMIGRRSSKEKRKQKKRKRKGKM